LSTTSIDISTSIPTIADTGHQKFIGQITSNHIIPYTNITIIVLNKTLFFSCMNANRAAETIVMADPRPSPTSDLHWSDYRGAIHQIFAANANKHPERTCVVETASSNSPKRVLSLLLLSTSYMLNSPGLHIPAH